MDHRTSVRLLTASDVDYASARAWQMATAAEVRAAREAPVVGPVEALALLENVPVAEVVDPAFVEVNDAQVVAQVTLSVEQCLVGFGPLAELTRVLSKDIALAQCRGWLSRHAPQAALVETDSTAAPLITPKGLSGSFCDGPAGPPPPRTHRHPRT